MLFEWRSLDHVAIEESHAPISTDTPFDYFHVNSIELDADGNYLVSARNTWAIYKIDRGSGNVIWRLGGKKSDFAMGPGTVFAWQHDARHHGATDQLVSLFDDGAAPQVQPQSKALVLALDTKRMRATLHRRYTHDPPVLSHALGSTQLLPNGNVLVGWGTAPWLSEYTHDGELVFDASPAVRRAELSRAEDAMARPADRPTGDRSAPSPGSPLCLRELERRHRRTPVALRDRPDGFVPADGDGDPQNGVRDRVPGAHRGAVHGGRRTRRPRQAARALQDRELQLRSGLRPHAPTKELPGSSTIRSSVERKAFGGQVIGSTARLRRATSGRGSPVNSISQP